jgi:hypothetical protein
MLPSKRIVFTRYETPTRRGFMKRRSSGLSHAHRITRGHAAWFRVASARPRGVSLAFGFPMQAFINSSHATNPVMARVFISQKTIPSATACQAGLQVLQCTSEFLTNY